MGNRTATEIIKEMTKTQNVFDRLTMEIGQLHASQITSKNTKQTVIINEKVKVWEQVEHKLQELETELKNSKK